MRKLKLQMQITVDGFVAGPEGQLDWMTWDMDEKLIAFINHLTDTTDTILLGRKMTEGFMRRMGSRQGVCCGSSGRHSRSPARRKEVASMAGTPAVRRPDPRAAPPDTLPSLRSSCMRT